MCLSLPSISTSCLCELRLILPLASFNNQVPTCTWHMPGPPTVEGASQSVAKVCLTGMDNIGTSSSARGEHEKGRFNWAGKAASVKEVTSINFKCTPKTSYTGFLFAILHILTDTGSFEKRKNNLKIRSISRKTGREGGVATWQIIKRWETLTPNLTDYPSVTRIFFCLFLFLSASLICVYFK